MDWVHWWYLVFINCTCIYIYIRRHESRFTFVVLDYCIYLAKFMQVYIYTVATCRIFTHRVKKCTRNTSFFELWHYIVSHIIRKMICMISLSHFIVEVIIQGGLENLHSTPFPHQPWSPLGRAITYTEVVVVSYTVKVKVCWSHYWCAFCDIFTLKWPNAHTISVISTLLLLQCRSLGSCRVVMSILTLCR